VTVNEDSAQRARERTQAAEQEAERLARHVTQDPELREEWLRQDDLIYGGLVAIGVVFVQALLPYPWMPPPRSAFSRSRSRFRCSPR